jgi:hypothetical protein
MPRAQVTKLAVENAPAQHIRKLTARDLIELMETDRITARDNIEFLVQICARSMCKAGGELVYNGSADALLDQPVDMLTAIAEAVQAWSGWTEQAAEEAGKERESPDGGSPA